MEALQVTFIFVIGMAAFATGRIRHDLVAVIMLLASLLVGLVSPAAALTGFSDPAVVTVAGVMILSATIARSGLLHRALGPFRSILVNDIAIAAVFAGLCAVASAFMNNIGALALLMPAALAACRSAKVSAGRVLMPMAFASLLGGLITLIGTPPNVIISEIRADFAGTPFTMFDFTPVGLGVAVAGVGLLVATIRFFPVRLAAGDEPLLFRIADYLYEARVPARRRAQPLTVGALRIVADSGETIEVHAIDRDGIIFTAPNDRRHLRPGDIVQLEGRAPLIQALIERHGLTLVGGEEDDGLQASILECVVGHRSSLITDHDPRQRLKERGAAVLAMSRNDRAIVERLDKMRVRSGDVLLLQVQEGQKVDVLEEFALLPLADRPLQLRAAQADWRPALALAGAIAATAFQLTSLAIALIAAISVLALWGRIEGRIYREIDWSIIVLLAAIIPVSRAFTDVGAAAAAGAWLAEFAADLPRLWIIGLVLGLTMMVTPFLNNVAAVLVMAPVAAQLGVASGAGIDALLMAVAVGASCDFLTPVGHQSNTLVLGPGGYRFLDYTRMGAPLSLLVLVLGSCLIAVVW